MKGALSMYVDIFNTEKKYSIIYADPPWSYKAWDKGGNGCALNHYGTMTKQDIYNLPVGGLAADDCTLFMWCTYPCLEQGLETMKRWGFTYKTLGFNWVKRNKSGNGWFWGLGFWTRSNPEVCLIGVKGKPRRASASVHSIIDTPIEGHSKKPDVVRERIMELMGGGTAIELFARQCADGWDCWGNEAPTESEDENNACAL
jgi:N6-adenosine-specific RNA methylase IME4